jgi:transcriptional regulator with XRE-family HTH domain
MKRIIFREDNAMSLQNVIVDIRNTHKMSQEDFAAKLFVTRQAVSRWENGETTPTIDTLKNISEVFNVEAATLLGLSETPVCQSCSMPLQEIADFGTNADDTVTTEYCGHCYKGGAFTHNRSIEEMVDFNLRFLDEWNAQNGTSYTENEARDILKMHLSTLNRWKEKRD